MIYATCNIGQHRKTTEEEVRCSTVPFLLSPASAGCIPFYEYIFNMDITSGFSKKKTQEATFLTYPSTVIKSLILEFDRFNLWL